MTIGPEPIIRIFAMSVRFGMMGRCSRFGYNSDQRGGRLSTALVRARLGAFATWSKGKPRWASEVGLILFRSSLRAYLPLPLLHQLHEIFEQIMRIVRARRCFRVILHG